MAEEQVQEQPQPFTPSDALAARAVALLRERLPEALMDAWEQRSETTVLVRPDAIEAVCLALRDAPDLSFDYLSQITAVDWPERDPRFEVVYHLQSLQTHALLRLKVRVGDEDTPEPSVPTVSTVWPAADWYEREVFDLFGIRFDGHPNLTRILMPPDWVGHPLRKDYPLTGIHLPEPHWGGQVPFDQPLPEGIGAQTLRSRDGVEEPPVAGSPSLWGTGKGARDDD